MPETCEIPGTSACQGQALIPLPCRKFGTGRESHPLGECEPSLLPFFHSSVKYQVTGWYKP